MPEWSFLTNHARVLLCIAEDPGVRLRDIAATLHITERSAYGIVADLAAAGYVVKQRDGRRNRYIVQHDLPIPETDAPRTHGRRDARSSCWGRRPAAGSRRNNRLVALATTVGAEAHVGASVDEMSRRVGLLDLHRADRIDCVGGRPPARDRLRLSQ